MAIQNFPSQLVPIIQQGYLEQMFEDTLRSKLAYRGIARREMFRTNIGETLTKTRPGLKAVATTPIVPTSNTNFDNGLPASPANVLNRYWTVEQYTITLQMYGDGMDLNTVTERVGIENQFYWNNTVNAEQAARTLDTLAQDALFNAYLGGSTRVTTTLGATGPTIHVDDVRGFQFAPLVNNAGFTSASAELSSGALSPTYAPVSGSNTLAVQVGADIYQLSGVTLDTGGAQNSSAAASGGLSGSLTFTTNVTIADGTAGNAVISQLGPTIKRPSARATTALLQATDTLTMSVLLDAVAQLRANAVPDIAGAYNCYLDPVSARQLFADPDFKQLFQGATSGNRTFKSGEIADFLGLRFYPTTQSFVQPHPSIANLFVRRPIVVGAEALIEGDFEGLAATDVAPSDSLISVVDGIAMVIREPLDRFQQIISQTWYWIGGYTAPTDFVTNNTIVPTANNAVYKRAVAIEHVG